MRDVAACANVALGTIYRYFVGKDHLLAAALVEWARDLSAASA
jgi:AcrR family transcriptional regulator